jgi:prevent-host-death family protein
MKIAPMADVRNHFAKYLEACARGPVFVTKNGRVTAVLEAMADEDIEDYLLERSSRFRSMLRKVKREPGGMEMSPYRKARRI